MPCFIKLDEDLSPLVAEPLIMQGHNVASVVSQGWSGMSDDELWPRIMAEKRLLITADKGFGDLRAYPPGSHAGIVLLRPDRESILDFRRLVEMLLDQHDLAGLGGSLTVVTPRGIRIRRA